jgi:hypothetical protein
MQTRPARSYRTAVLWIVRRRGYSFQHWQGSRRRATVPGVEAADQLMVAPGAERSIRDKQAVPASADAFTLIHHLIAVAILSSKISLSGRVFKEGVKVFTPKFPPSADNPSLDLPTLQVLSHSAGAKAQHARRFAKREKAVSQSRARQHLTSCAFSFSGFPVLSVFFRLPKLPILEAIQKA